MELLQPVECTGKQKVEDFLSAIINDQGPSVLMFTTAGISMFIQGCTIKTGESVCILGKVSWHPIKQHADIVLVTTAYKKA